MRIIPLATAALLASTILVGCGQREAARTTADRQSGATGQPAPAGRPADGAVRDQAAESAALVADAAAGTKSAAPRAEVQKTDGAVTSSLSPGEPAGAESRSGARVYYANPTPRFARGQAGFEARSEMVLPGRNNPNFNTETYDHLPENEFIAVTQQPLSTFSIDVDTASYANVRRFLANNSLPPAGAVRIEELINYFPYEYEPPAEGEKPFAVHVEMAACPWNPEHELARIALKGREIDFQDRTPVNLVFLLDVSGSMRSSNKLSYVKESMRLLVDKLGENDQVTIVVYAGAEGLALPTTTADHREAILEAIGNLQAGGSTNGGAGIKLAYDKAIENFIEEGVNRVILCTDGDFNVGITNQSELVNLIEEKSESGVFLSVLGYGMGNYKDSTMEKLADKGNGNYAYIDSLSEARKVLVEQITGTLITIAKDVKIQVDFNPAHAASYRLVGYENRKLAAEDFQDDTKDAGEIGAGHTVTALYELVPPGAPNPAGAVKPSKYQTQGDKSAAAESDEVCTVRLRYKEPDGDKSTLVEVPLEKGEQPFEKASESFRFAAAVAQFGMLLRESEFVPNANWSNTREIAASSLGEDEHGYRAEFLELVDKAATLSGEEAPGRETARR